jgi:DNA-binding NarL/FixJ family response regulator
MKNITVTFVSSRDGARQHCADLVMQNRDIDLIAIPSSLSQRGAWQAIARTDVVVIDESVVQQEGFTAVRMILDSYPGINSLIIMDNASRDAMTWTLLQGVRGVMVQDDIDAFLAKAIRRINAGEVWMSRTLVEWLRDPAQQPTGRGSAGKEIP